MRITTNQVSTTKQCKTQVLRYCAMSQQNTSLSEATETHCNIAICKLHQLPRGRSSHKTTSPRPRYCIELPQEATMLIWMTWLTTMGCIQPRLRLAVNRGCLREEYQWQWHYSLTFFSYGQDQWARNKAQIYVYDDEEDIKLFKCLCLYFYFYVHVMCA